jgi:hypothetical protein
MFLQLKAPASAPQFYMEFQRTHKPYLYSIEREFSLFQQITEALRPQEYSSLLEIYGTSEAESRRKRIIQRRGQKDLFIGGNQNK